MMTRYRSLLYPLAALLLLPLSAAAQEEADDETPTATAGRRRTLAERVPAVSGIGVPDCRECATAPQMGQTLGVDR